MISKNNARIYCVNFLRVYSDKNIRVYSDNNLRVYSDITFAYTAIIILQSLFLISFAYTATIIGFFSISTKHIAYTASGVFMCVCFLLFQLCIHDVNLHRPRTQQSNLNIYLKRKTKNTPSWNIQFGRSFQGTVDL